MRVAFRANGGGAGIGLGHLSRCLSIADALKEKGVQSWFISKDYRPGVQFVRDRGYEVRTISSQSSLEQDLQESIELMHDADVVVADSYEFNEQYLAGLSKSKKMVVAIDDMLDRNLPVDVVIGNAYARRADYGSKMPEHAVLLSGPQFLPLRKEFGNLPHHSISEKVDNVIVMMGGEDTENVTQQVVDALSEYKRKLSATVVVGSAYPYLKELNDSTQKSHHTYTIKQNISDLVPLYQSAGVAFATPSVTFWELAAAGTPAILIQKAENQSGVARFAKEHNIGLFLGWDNKISGNDIIAGFEKIENRDLRETQSRNEQRLVDGKGSERIAEALIKEYQNRGVKQHA